MDTRNSLLIRPTRRGPAPPGRGSADGHLRPRPAPAGGPLLQVPCPRPVHALPSHKIATEMSLAAREDLRATRPRCLCVIFFIDLSSTDIYSYQVVCCVIIVLHLPSCPFMSLHVSSCPFMSLHVPLDYIAKSFGLHLEVT